MARIERVIITDDIDGSEATETMQFGLGSETFEIDLSHKNLERFRAVLGPYMSAATELNPKPRTHSSGVNAAAVRQWAQKSGLAVSPQGRLKKEVIDAYVDAQGL